MESTLNNIKKETSLNRKSLFSSVSAYLAIVSETTAFKCRVFFRSMRFTVNSVLAFLGPFFFVIVPPIIKYTHLFTKIINILECPYLNRYLLSDKAISDRLKFDELGSF
jgi:hypothetical protein